MTFAERPQPHDVPGGNAGHGDASCHGGPASPTPPPSLSPELVSRFHALIEEVTDELMQGQNFDRATCRADAITMLIATSAQVEGPEEAAESPLMYLLQEERQKAAALLSKAGSATEPLTYLKV